MMLQLAVLAASLACARADFIYVDFNDTTGISFVGDAATTSCDDGLPFKYQPRHGTMDDIDNGTLLALRASDTAHTEKQDQTTNDHASGLKIANNTAVIGHRDDFGPSPDLTTGTCPIRMRLTSAQPEKLGAFWRLLPVPVFGGFETVFVFQVTDQSRSCTEVRDRQFRTLHHKSCTVHGGDGFAFVMQLDPNATRTVGRRGSGLGYAGIRNALVVEFDTWHNPEEGDHFFDHVSVQLSGPDGVITSGEHSRLAALRPHAVADGRQHVVRVVYYKYINYDYVNYFTASTYLATFLKDNGEGRRIGTFVVFVDDMDVPLIAFPINLSLGLNLPEADAFVGFTASTARTWQKHDILTWVWCDLPDCPLSQTRTQVNGNITLDHHQESRLHYRRLLAGKL